MGISQGGRSLCDNVDLRRFQQTFIKNATAPGIDTAVLSIPRGNGKSFLAGHLCYAGPESC